MHSSLWILQITLIITQITTVKGSSLTSAVNSNTNSAAAPTSASPNSIVALTSETNSALTSAVNSNTNSAAAPTSASPNSIVALTSETNSALTSAVNSNTNSSAAPTSASPSSIVAVTSETNSVDSNSVQAVSSMTIVLVTSSTNHLTHSSFTVSSNRSISGSSPMQTWSSMISVLANSSTDQSTNASGDSATPSEASGSVKLLPSTSLESNVTPNSLELHSASEPRLMPSSFSGNTTKTSSPTMTVPNTISTESATRTDNASSHTSAKAATSLSSHSMSGLLTSPTQSTPNYSISSASRRGSVVLTTAESKQTLITSLSVSVNWTDWSVDSSHCQEYCSEKGGTVTASRQCYSHTKTLDRTDCTKHDNATKVVKCDDHCPISGKEAFGSSIYTLAVSILLVMLSTFVWD